MSEFGLLLQSARDFDVTIADTPDKLRAAYQLRHQVYCTELGYEPGQESALETDCFDRHASHALLTRCSTGQVVGTVRIVGPSSDLAAELPMQRLCPPHLFHLLPMTRTGEISRFAISKDLRGSDRGDTVPLRLGLMRGIVEMSASMGLTHWCAVMEHSLLRLLRMSGIHLQSLGPAVEHHGLRQPSWGRIDDVLARMREERPAVWEYLTDSGSLWPAAKEPTVGHHEHAIQLAFDLKALNTRTTLPGLGMPGVARREWPSRWSPLAHHLVPRAEANATLRLARA